MANLTIFLALEKLTAIRDKAPDGIIRRGLCDSLENIFSESVFHCSCCQLHDVIFRFINPDQFTILHLQDTIHVLAHA